MAWTPPKKKISPEKALSLARQRATPLWVRGKALFWPEQDTPESAVQLRVLEPEFSKGIHAFAFFEPGHDAGAGLGRRFKELFDRYSDLGIEFYCVIQAPASQQEFPAEAKSWFQHEHWSIAALADAGGLLSRCWGLQTHGKGLVIFKGGQLEQLWNPDVEELKAFELRFQAWLRVEDPGLPLIDPNF